MQCGDKRTVILHENSCYVLITNNIAFFCRERERENKKQKKMEKKSSPCLTTRGVPYKDKTLTLHGKNLPGWFLDSKRNTDLYGPENQESLEPLEHGTIAKSEPNYGRVCGLVKLKLWRWHYLENKQRVNNKLNLFQGV